ncbi:MAG: DNA primase [candidate division Zixibacteria bacterium]|nr:DNA primase [candidate division Zixibacteria bacterium]
MIPQETIEQIRQATDIADLISGYIRLKKRGRNYLALCPFHTERTASFSVSQDKQIFHCFGCGKGGNVFSFLMEHERMSFVEAVKELAQKANIIIKEDKGSDFKRDLIERISYANQVAVEYFRETLRQDKFKIVLEDYLKGKRKITSESIETFKLGLAGDEWEGLLRHAKRKDISEDEMVRAGLAIHNQSKNSHYDRFRHRLMIPIYNLSGKPIAFGGRTLKKDEPAKYINSPETPLYRKGYVLYGLSDSKDHIRKSNFAYVVEGYFDLISLWQAGIKNVVASSGTAFTLQQARLLGRFAEEVYLFFDSDSAGEKAALKSVDVLYDAGLEVKIITYPKGEDPDSLANKYGSDKIEELKNEALGFIPFRLKNIYVSKSGIIDREKLIKEFQLIGNKIGDTTRRTLFFDEAADEMGLNQAIFQTQIQAPKTVTVENSSAQQKFNPVESGLLSLLFHSPGSTDEIFELISPDDFDSKALGRLYSAMIDQYRVVGNIEARALIDAAGDEELKQLIARIAALEWPADQIESETAAHARIIVENKKVVVRNRLQLQLAEAEAKGDREKADTILDELKSYGIDYK